MKSLAASQFEVAQTRGQKGFLKGTSEKRQKNFLEPITNPVNDTRDKKTKESKPATETTGGTIGSY